MNFQHHIKNHQVELRVTPHSSRTELIEEEGKLKLYLKSVPEKNKANQELIKFFRKEFNLKVQIRSGMKSRDKVLVIV